MLTIEGKKYLSIVTMLIYDYQRKTISIEYNSDRKKGYIFENEKTEEVSKRLTKEIIRSSFDQILEGKKLIGLKSSLEENAEKLYSLYMEILNIIAEDPESNVWGWRDDNLHYKKRIFSKSQWIDIE